MPTIVQSFNRVTDSLISLVQSDVFTTIKQCGIESNDIIQSSETKLDSYRKPLDFLSTGYKQNKYFNEHPSSVLPERVYFVPRMEYHAGSSRFVYDSFEYISEKNTVSALLQNYDYMSALLQAKCMPGVIASFSDGQKYREHGLFSNSTKFSLML